MTTSRAGSASAGEASNVQHKANRASQHNDSRINGSNRVFGLDGASDDYGSAAHHPGHSSRHPLTPSDRKYRALSRSPSPYRHKPNRSLSRSRSPYRKDRSPSPFRHGGRGGYDSRPYKRKASPPYHRPEKRHLTERNRPEPRHKPFSDDVRAAQHQPGSLKEHKDVTERPYVKPISYAELEHPSAVPNFQSGLPTNGQAQKSRSYDHERGRTGYEMSRQSKPSTIGVQAQVVPPAQAKDVEMKNTSGESDDIAAPVEEIVPTEESREEKRRRWAAKRAALAEQQKNDSLLHQAILTNASVVTTPTGASPMRYADHSMSPFGSPQTGNFDSASASPDVMFDKQEGVSGGNSPAAESPSAANYDPVQDMLDDRDRAARKNHNSELSSGAYRETDPNLLSTLPAEKARPVRKQTKELDMFASDEEDEEAEVVLEHDVEARGTVLDEKLLDNWDDPDGYYKLISNELVNNGRYRMVRHLGRGVFANVAQAVDVEAQTDDPSRQLVAIKMIRRNELMRKASQKEMDFLYKANDADPQDKRHIIRLLGSFDHKGHLCIVFEHMSKNLRDLLKEETNGHGLTLSAVRIYAKQMLHGLQHLQGCQIIHLDIKPDNILVSADKKTIKLADFGTAVDKRDIIERTEYLVSRFYRAPEIILGMDISYPVDMWAIGCTIYELWTGKILFTGRSNNQMVKAFIDCLGWPSEKLLKKGLAVNILDHFELGSSLMFISREVDKHNKVIVRKIVQQKKINRDMKIRVHEAARGIASGGPTVGELNDLTDLLSGCLHMNVEKRSTPKEAINHRIFGSKSFPPKPTVVKPSVVKRGTTGIRR